MQNQTKKYALYARRSVGSSEDLMEQFSILRTALPANVDETLIECYQDIAPGLAGFEPDATGDVRPGLRKLAEDIKAGRIRCLCVAAADRLARNKSVLLQFEELCGRHDVRVMIADKEHSQIKACAATLAAGAIKAASKDPGWSGA